MASKPPETFLSRTWDYITETQVWRSIFRHGMPSMLKQGEHAEH